MTDAPLTIVIPVYNRRDVVGRTLDSVLAQTFRPLKVILVDNNSTDDSLSVICRWRDKVDSPDLRVSVIEERRAGACHARNTGLERVDTPWVMFFDSDDTMRPNLVASAMEVLRADDKVDMVGWRVAIHSLDSTVAIKPFMRSPDVFDCVMEGTMATQRYMCRTSLVRRAGGWDPSVMRWNDIELGVRLLLTSSLNISYIDGGPLVDVYSGADSISGLDFHSSAAKCEHSLDVISGNLPQSLKYIVRLKRAILAANYYKEGFAEDARTLLQKSVADAGRIERLLLTFAYHYSKSGGRGAAKILKCLYRT